MTEPTAATVSEAAAPERDVLLATKLNMPRPGPGLVPPPRLAQRLDDGLRRGLVLVCAPAGYGKTVLLADWRRWAARSKRGKTGRPATRRNIRALVLRLARENPDYVDSGIMWSLAAD